MNKTSRLLVPASEHHTEIVVVNSRFIAAIAPVFSVEEARDFIAKIRAAHPNATHNVPAFIIGHGASVIEHCSDDGEPQGTAGRPALAVLKSSGLGDAAVVVTRYFGGTKLGTGGLVRAYTDAVKSVLVGLPLAEKIPTHTVRLALPYPLFERVRILIAEHGGQILDENFAVDVTLTLQFAAKNLTGFQGALREASKGALQVEIIETHPATIFPVGDGL
ncbi:MAG: YigZ family protein [Bellilinea sp.]